MARTSVHERAGFTLIELLIVVAIIGTIAAIAIPSLLRARLSANEARAIGDTRSVISASHAYAGANCGFFAHSLDCMNRAAGICIPNYPTAAPEFLAGDLGRVTPYSRGGYVRDYLPRGMPAALGPACDPQSQLNFCYTSVPESPGFTGIRSFSGGANGAVYLDPSGAPINCPVPNGTAYLE